jgi:hypothetical protein
MAKQITAQICGVGKMLKTIMKLIGSSNDISGSWIVTV